MVLTIMFARTLVISLVIAFVAGNDCSLAACPKIPRHYLTRGLKCKPIVPEGKCCPTRFECESVKDNTKCHFNGVKYDIGARIPDEIVGGVCIASCYCSMMGNDMPPQWECAQFDCPEFYIKYNSSCIKQETPTSCCSTNIICEQEEIDNLATCFFEDKEYREGQLMHPKEDNCYTCVCNSNYDNSTIIGNPYCEEKFCDEVFYIEKYQSGCIPVYSENSSCCPKYFFKCPSENDTIIPAAEARSAEIENDTNYTCQYGRHTLKIGDGISDENKCITCTCSMPPFAHCVETKC